MTADATTQTQRFTAPGPLAVELDAAVADVDIVAGPGDIATVHVAPKRPGKARDIEAAQRTLVELAGDRLFVRTPRRWQSYAPWGRYEAVAIRLELPQGSSVEAKVGMGDIRSQGALGPVRARTGAGKILLDRVGTSELTTGAGDIGAAVVAGDIRSKTGTGEVTLGLVQGQANVTTGAGSLNVDRLEQGGHVRTGSGKVTLNTLAGGSLSVATGIGDIYVGLAPGVAAKLELHGTGVVQSGLSPTDGPAEGQTAVTVKARTGMGDIHIARAGA